MGLTNKQLAGIKKGSEVASNVTEAVQALSAIGIHLDEDSCSLEDIQDKITKLVGRLQDDIKKTIDDLSYRSAGNFFQLVYVLLKEFVGGAATALVDNFVGKVLFESVLGAINSALATVLATIPGSLFVIQYYAAESLLTQLKRRQELALIILNEIRTLISWLNAFNDVGSSFDISYFNNINLAHQQVRKATRLIGAEISGLQTERKQYVSGKSVGNAVEYIDNSLAYLTPGYAAVQDQLKAIHEDFGLETELPFLTIELSADKKFLDIAKWDVYIKDLWKELGNKFDLGTSEGRAQLKKVLFRFLPTLPEFLRKFAVNTVVENTSTVLIERLPIWSLKIAKKQKWMTWTLTPPKEFRDFIEILADKRSYPLFSRAETKNITWQRTMNKTKIAESALLLAPTYMDIIKQHSGMLKTLLDPGYNYLKAVYDDMDGVITDFDKNPIGVRQLNVDKKFSTWTRKLIMSKNLLSATIGGSGIQIKGYGESVNLQAGEVTDYLVAIEDALTKLETFIENKNDSDGKEIGNQVLTIANNNLLALAGQAAAFVINPGLSANLIANLRAVETLVNEQYKLDSEEIIFTQNFMNQVERFPGFSIIKKYVDSLINKMGDGKALFTSVLAGQLLTGDLSSIAGYLDVADFGWSATQCAATVGKEGMSKVSDSLKRLRLGEKEQRDIQQTVTNLKSNKAKIDVMTATLQALPNYA